MYEEHAVSPALSKVVACTWQHTSDDETLAAVVPDACVDIVWDGTRLAIAGPDTRPVQHMLRTGTRIVGLRFATGAAGGLLGVPASAVRDASVELQQLWGDPARRLAERLDRASNDGHAVAAMRALQDAVSERLRTDGGQVDELVLAATRALRRGCQGSQGAQEARAPGISQLAAALGVSERQLRRRCDAAVGYGPKFLSRVLRFQALRQRMRSDPQLSLAQLASALGYVDQAHLTHEFGELSGSAPGRLRRAG